MIHFSPEKGMKIYLSDELKSYGHSYDESESFENNFMDLLSLRRRLPKAIPRIIIELKDFEIPPHMMSGYKEVCRKINFGISIKPHLSRSIDNIKYNDLLLNSWNIHHLHLSSTPDNSGFVQRTGPVLFAMFFDNVVICIDILEHGRGHSDVWVNDRLIQRLHDYAPSVLERMKVKNVSRETYTSQQKLSLRKNHVNHIMSMSDNTNYHLMGLTASGHFIGDQFYMMNIRREMDHLEELTQLNESIVFEKLGLDLSQNLLLTFIIHEGKVRIYHLEKRTIINFNQPPQ